MLFVLRYDQRIVSVTVDGRIGQLVPRSAARKRSEGVTVAYAGFERRAGRRSQRGYTCRSARILRQPLSCAVSPDSQRNTCCSRPLSTLLSARPVSRRNPSATTEARLVQEGIKPGKLHRRYPATRPSRFSAQLRRPQSQPNTLRARRVGNTLVVDIVSTL